ncbi:hypothetical protein A2U01_0013970, partial [Trifolium medium]|nr:hypothetical protein [Trifolium medium]
VKILATPIPFMSGVCTLQLLLESIEFDGVWCWVFVKLGWLEALVCWSFSVVDSCLSLEGILGSACCGGVDRCLAFGVSLCLP